MAYYTNSSAPILPNKMESTRALLQDSKLPSSFWVDSLLTAIYLINRLPSPTIKNKSPYHLLYRKKPTYTHLKIFGCSCFPWIPTTLTHKLQPRSSQCIFLGYCTSQKGYKYYHPPTKKLYISRHVIFDETTFPWPLHQSHPASSSTQHTLPPSLLTPITNPPATVLSTPLQPTNTVATTPTLLHHPTDLHPNIPTNLDPAPPTLHPRHHMITRSQSGHSKPCQILDLHNSIQSPDPTSFNQANKHSHWRQAMSLEFMALQQQGTWELVPIPPNHTVLGCRWTYKTKYHSDGSIARHKARLVAKGFNQTQGLDYTQTFSPVAKMQTIRVLLSIAAHHHWCTQQLDVSNAFLHGKLEDTVYMQQPAGFTNKDHPNHVCLLKKAIYGLKQSPRQWYSTFSNFLINYGFQTSTTDSSLLVYHKDNNHIYLLIYVDDILLTGNNPTELTTLIQKLNQAFNMKQLGEVSQFIGIQINKTATGYFLHQNTYLKTLLNSTGLADCKPVLTPLPTKSPTSTPNSNLSDISHSYHQTLGSLQYLTNTRPDITYCVNTLCQHMHNPQPHHFQLLKRVLGYLKGTQTYGLPISASNLQLTSYSDFDWAGDHSDRKSTTRYCSFLGSNLISWSSKKQPIVARSSTEAEYRALASAITDVIWLRRLLQDFHITSSSPTTIHCDSTSAIALAHNPVFHARTKHIEVDYHFIRDHLHSNEINLTHIATQDQIADIFTKSHTNLRHSSLLSKLTVSPPHISLRGGNKPHHTK